MPQHEETHARGSAAGITQELGGALAPLLLREGFARVLEELVRAEEAETPAIRRLGLKFVERAVDVLGELFEAAAAFAPPSLLVDSPSELLPETDEAIASQLDPASIALLRLELTTFVAFDLIRDQSVDELVTWARRARITPGRNEPAPGPPAPPPNPDSERRGWTHAP